MDSIDFDFTTNKGIKAAFEEGYRLDENSPITIRSNPNVLSIAIEYDANQLNYGTIESLSDKNITKALAINREDNYFFPDESTPDKVWDFIIQNKNKDSDLWISYLRKIPPKFITKALVDETVTTALECNYSLCMKHNILSNSSDFIRESVNKEPRTINFAIGNGLTNDNIELALNNGYSFNVESPEYLKKNAEIIKKSIKNRPESIRFVKEENVTDEIIKYAINCGYILDKRSPKFMKENQFVIKHSIVNSPQSFNHLFAKNQTEENLNLALEHGYFLNSESPIHMMNDLAIKKCIKNNCNSINSLPKEKITQEIILLALDYGYVLNINSSNVLRNHPEMVRGSILKKIDSINYAREDGLTEENINLAIEKGYLLNGCSLDILRNNPKVVKASIGINPQTLEYALEGGLTEENILLAINNGFILTVNACEKLADNAIINNYYLQKCCTLYGKELDVSSLFQKYGIYTELGLKSGVFDKSISEEFGANAQSRIFKYLVLSEKIGNIYDYVDKENLAEFKYIYSYIAGGVTSFEKFNPLLFENVLRNYNNYRDLSLKVIQSGNHNLLSQLKFLYTRKEIMNISSLDDLSNISDKIYQEHLTKIESTTNEHDLYEVLCLSTFNRHYSEIKDVLSSVINSDKCDNLLKSVKDESIRNQIKKVQLMLQYVEHLLKKDDVNELKYWIKKINDTRPWENEHLNNLFSNIENIAKQFYTQDINENMTSINNLSECQNNKYFSDFVISGPNSGTIEIGKKEVKLLEADSSSKFFAHVTNAYGKFGKITDWKNPRMIGRTHLCLSAISSIKRPVERMSEDIDTGITLLFDHLEQNSLVSFASYDIYSSSRYNDLNVSASGNCNTLDMILENTDIYNEYVVYRENEDGSIIYPSGVMISGDEPTQIEINAAAYLDVPLVRFPQQKTKDEITNEIINSSVKSIDNKRNIEILQSAINNMFSSTNSNNQSNEVDINYLNQENMDSFSEDNQQGIRR